jgi:GT2 family glycosyltransferase
VRDVPLVTVVIPTFNRGAILRRVVDALRALEESPGGHEIVVVDDGSEPGHVERFEAALAALPNARLIRQENAGPAAARNLGVRESTSELVAFLDDDCSPDTRWLIELTRPFLEGDERLGAVGGRVLPAPPTNWVSRFCAAVEYSSGLQAVFENAATANACYRRSVLQSVGGFDEGFLYPGGDDPDLSLRTRSAGYRLDFVESAVVFHAELDSYRDFIGHWYKRGLGSAMLGRKHGGTRRIVLRLLLFPAFLARIGVLVWRRTNGKGSPPQRAFWALLEISGQAAFVAGTISGLWRH